MIVYVPSAPSASARSKPRRELAGETPGMPGSGRSSDPCSTASRRPRSGSSESRSGNHGARPTHGLDGRLVRDQRRDGAAHREAEQQRPLRADGVDRRARVLGAPVEPVPRLDPVAHLARTRARRSAARGGATSHSSEALHVPSTSAAWPPFTQTTAELRAGGPVTRSSAPLRSFIRRPRRPAGSWLTARQVDEERRAGSLDARDGDRGRRALRRSPSRSRARGRRRGSPRSCARAVRKNRSKSCSCSSSRDAHAGVGDLDPDCGRWCGYARTSTRAAGGRELERVRDEVVDHLADAQPVAVAAGSGSVEQSSAMPRAAATGRARLRRACATIGGDVELASSRARPCPAFACAVSRRSSTRRSSRSALRSITSSQLSCVGGELGLTSLEQQLEVAADRRQRRPQLVRDERDELVLHPVELAQPLVLHLRLAEQRLAVALRLLARGDVDREPLRVPRLAGLVADDGVAVLQPDDPAVVRR